MKILITGGAGFIGSHIAEFYARQNKDIVVFDNLSRASLLKQSIKKIDYNWNFLRQFKNIKLIKGDIKNFSEIEKAVKNVDIIIHAAAQTAVTISIKKPMIDFETNALGTFNVLEAARRNDVKSVLYCSTNKIYGDNVNSVNINEKKFRYVFEKKYQNGIPENFPIDFCEHTPYGCSKLTGDLYAQDYGRLYGIKTGIFRMSCIYGTRQFGVEDQGWISWFIIAKILGKKLTVYGDGKQVRDVLYVTDLIDLFDKFICSKLKHVVLNTGGGPENTLSLLELIETLKKITDKKTNIKFSDWRPSDQKVFISDIRKARKILGWKPKVNPTEGIKKVYDWVLSNDNLFR